MSSPFFDDPLDEYKPKPNFPFDVLNEDDWTDEKLCPVCSVTLEDHSTKQIVECALIEIKHPKGGDSHKTF